MQLRWIEACIKESIMPITEMDEGLRNGVILAKLGRMFEPAAVRKIFDAPNLQWRHSDNITYFLAACKSAGFPEIFYFEMTDLYDRKNIPKVIYCVHALAFFLSKLGKAPKIKNLIGELQFTDAEINAAKEGLDASGVVIPHFGGIGNALAKEMKEPTEEELRLAAEKEAEEAARRAEEERIAEETRQREAAEKAAREREEFLLANEATIIRLQACFRSVAAQKAYQAERKRILAEEPAFINIQSLVRGLMQRRQYAQDLQNHDTLESAAIKVQFMVKVNILY